MSEVDCLLVNTTTIDETSSTLPVVKDTGHRIYSVVLIYAIAMLAPWNAVLSTMPFFSD